MREEEEGYTTWPLSVGLTVQLGSTKPTKNFKFKCGKSSLGLNVY